MLSQEEKTLARECLDMALECGAQKARVSFNKSSMDMVATLNGEVDKVTACLDSSLEICISRTDVSAAFPPTGPKKRRCADSSRAPSTRSACSLRTRAGTSLLPKGWQRTP